MISKLLPGRNSTQNEGLRLLLRNPLRCLGVFLNDAVALELGDMIDEQHAVEVIDLVLQTGGEQVACFQYANLPKFGPSLG